MICLLSASYLFFVNKDIKNLLSVNRVEQIQSGNVPKELISSVSAAGNNELYNATWTPVKCRFASFSGLDVGQSIGVSRWLASYTINNRKIDETWSVSNWDTSNDLSSVVVDDRDWNVCNKKDSRLTSTGDYSYSYGQGELKWSGIVDSDGYLIIKARNNTSQSLYSSTLSSLSNPENTVSISFGAEQYITQKLDSHDGIESTTSFSNYLPTSCSEMDLSQTQGANKITMIDDNFLDDGMIILKFTDPAGGSSPYAFNLKCKKATGYSQPVGWTVSASQKF